MGRNLTSLPISASFQYLLQKSGSEVNDGLGADVDYLNISASYAYTASVADTAGSATTATSASHAVQADNASAADTATSASYATTASYAENGGVTSIIAGTNVTISPIGGTGDVTINATSETVNTGSFYVSSSITDATITFTQGDGSTESVEVNNVSSSISASHAVIADSALTANSATTSTSASHAVQADTATSASYALTASYVEGGDVTPTLQQVLDTGNEATGSILIQRDTTVGASFTIEKDGVNQVRFTHGDAVNALSLHASGSQVARLNFSSIPGEIETDGDLTITTVGGKVVATDISASGYISASEFIGPLTGNADTATTASYALTASYAENVTPINTGSFYTSSSIADATITFTQGDGSTESVEVNNVSSSISASHAIQADNADTATSSSHAIFADTAGSATTTTSASYATTSSFAENVGLVSGLGTDSMRSADHLTTVAPVASGNYSIALGESSNASGTDTISIGRSAVSPLEGGVAIGYQASAGNTNSIALGRGAQATGSYSLDIRANDAPVLSVLTTNQDAIFNAAVSASAFSGSFFGDGSGLTGVTATAFPYTGSAGILGDLLVDGNLESGNPNNSATGTDTVVIGGNNNSASPARSFVVGGESNSVSSGLSNGILGGTGNSVTNKKSVIVGGQNSTISHERSVIVGGSGLSSTKNDEVVVPNLSINGQALGNVGTISIASSTGSMDVSTANFFSLNLASGVDTHLDATNITSGEGQTITLFIRQDLTSAGTLSFSSDFLFEGGVQFEVTPSTGAKDVMTFVSDGTNLFATGLRDFS